MQDYPHYKYRPRRKKKDGNKPAGKGEGGSEGQLKRPQPPEPAYLQRVKEDSSLRLGSSSSSKSAIATSNNNNNNVSSPMASSSGGSSSREGGQRDAIDTPESSPSDQANEYNFFSSYNHVHQLPTPEISPHDSCVPLSSSTTPTTYSSSIMPPPPPPLAPVPLPQASPSSEQYEHYDPHNSFPHEFRKFYHHGKIIIGKFLHGRGTYSCFQRIWVPNFTT